MIIDYSDKFLKSYRKAPQLVQKSFQKQAQFLELDLRHPSLHAKKYNEVEDIWQARINRDWRFYFIIRNNTIYLIDIMAHPK